MKKIARSLADVVSPSVHEEVLYLAHNAEYPHGNDALFLDYKRAEAYIKDDCSCVAGEFQIFELNYELSPQGVVHVMNWLKDFYLNRED